MAIDKNSQKAITDAHRLRQAVFISGDALAITFQSVIIGIQHDHLLLSNYIKPKYIGAFMNSRAYSLQIGMVRFQSENVSSDGENIIFPLKDDSLIEETRQAERFSFTSEERVVVEILNPFDGETKITKTVMDMSATGLSLRTTFESKLFEPDTYIPNLRILIDGELYKKGPGRVVYRRKLMDQSGQIRNQVGIKFES
jgi:hypothetical protein